MDELLLLTEIHVEAEFNVNTYDIDVAGHVNNQVYIRWLEDMRNQLFSQLCPLCNLLLMDYYPVVVSGEMKYKRQIKLFDKPFGKMEISSYMHGIFILKAEIIVSKVTAFTALQKCVILNLKKNVIFKGDPLLLKNI